MKVLVIGSGGREHTLVWKISQSPLVEKVYAAPGNAGMSEIAECVPVEVRNLLELRDIAEENKIDLTVVGPEVPLCEGIVDLFHKKDLAVFGPNAAAAELESSKVFAKTIMRTHGIPTASFRVFDVFEAAKEHIMRRPEPMVVKADGLAAGKGVVVCETRDEAMKALESMMKEKIFGRAADRVIVEDKLEGEETSILAITDGKTILQLPTSQDHKAAFDGDRGPNTGGMGAYSPAPVVDDHLAARIESEVIVPMIHAMNREGHPLSGVLYAGLMIAADGEPKVLEFNVRFGDPETQPILMRLKSDIVPILDATARGGLENVCCEWDERPAVCVVMASGGYPGSYKKGFPISGLENAAALQDVQVFHAGTKIQDGKVVTAGGRVLGITALGDDISSATKRAYEAVDAISFEGAEYRTDIAGKAIQRLGDEVADG